MATILSVSVLLQKSLHRDSFGLLAAACLGVVLVLAAAASHVVLAVAAPWLLSDESPSELTELTAVVAASDGCC